MRRREEEEEEGVRREEEMLTFNVTVYDLQSVVEVVQSLKELEGVVKSCLGTERATLEHIALQAACENRK